ncbi:MAG TPA: hypothetical protein VK528_07880 [Flavobacterium sp.]|nr:hypothetical protein [Flavobacterium sp.]
MDPFSRIRLAYRIEIDQTASPTWDRYVFEDTFKEYGMQHQLFNSKENPKRTFRELLAENEKAEQLHYLVGLAANSYVQQLKGKLHRVADVLGNTFFPFENYRLDIVNTDIMDVAKHKIGITFYSPLFTFIDIANNCYLVSTNMERGNGFETILFPAQKNLAICYFEEKSS